MFVRGFTASILILASLLLSTQGVRAKTSTSADKNFLLNPSNASNLLALIESSNLANFRFDSRVLKARASENEHLGSSSLKSLRLYNNYDSSVKDSSEEFPVGNSKSIEELVKDLLKEYNEGGVSESRQGKQFVSVMDSVVEPVRRLWPEVREAGKRVSNEVIPSIGNTLNKMGSEVVEAVRTKVIPSIEESLVDLTNDAVPVINRGIDVASEGIERGSELVSNAAAEGFRRIGMKVLGRRRHNRLTQFVNRLSFSFNDTIARFTNAITRMVEPHSNSAEYSSNGRQYYYASYDHDHYDLDRQSTDFNEGSEGYLLYQFRNDYNNMDRTDYNLYDADFMDPSDYYDYVHSNDYDDASDENSGMSRLVRNTAYMLARNIFGQNITNAISPLARSVSKSVRNVIPNVSYDDGRIVIDLPGAGTGRQGQDEDERSCTTPSGQDGLCKNLSFCADLVLDLDLLRRSICFKSLFTPGVCCPKSALRIEEEPSNPRPPIVAYPSPPSDSGRPSLNPRPPIPGPQVPVHPNAQFRCGVTRVPEQRVVGGSQSPRGKWPWMAAIFLHGPTKKEFWCGASLVSATVILTASHCTKDPDGKTFHPKQFSVRLGDYNILDSSDDYVTQPVELGVSRIVPHPRFQARGFYNDVALMRMDREVLFNDFIVPVCLPPPEMAQQDLDALAGRSATVIGFGSQAYDGPESPFLHEASLPIWYNKECDNSYLQPITEIFICAGYKEGGKDACQGDSGGPFLIYGPSKQWIQIGIVSFGNRCAEPGYPGVYTRLTYFMSWIHDNMINL